MYLLCIFAIDNCRDKFIIYPGALSAGFNTAARAIVNKSDRSSLVAFFVCFTFSKHADKYACVRRLKL